MSRVRKNLNVCDDENDGNASSSSKRKSSRNSKRRCHEIDQLTEVASRPNEHLAKDMPGRLKLPVSTVRMLAGREANYSGRGKFSSADSRHVLSRYLPIHGPYRVDKMKSRAYVSQFSDDGTLFVAGFQGSQIRIYNVDKGWKVQKDIQAKSLSWTITDTCLSPDHHYLVYSSMCPVVHIVNAASSTTESLANVTEIHHGLDFSTRDDYDDDDDGFGIFSVKFSTDGRELVAGSSDFKIHVYDLEANRSSLRMDAHRCDVNTVCFADETGHLIYSGGDDNLCKVWDRRCFISGERATGVLQGHLEGITFINSRGDGRYLISNGKDQSIKLWDIRKMSSNINYPTIRDPDWDYRWMEYPDHAKAFKHPQDTSLATYRGHSVLKTLIRCYFSPEYSTGQKYIYSGSSDGCVYIYDLVSGNEVAKLDYHSDVVRDCSWHPIYPMLVSSSWDHDVVRWEFPGDGTTPALTKRRPRRHMSIRGLM